jgi:hypothetical protein
MKLPLTAAAQARHFDAFYQALPETTRHDVDNIVEIHKAHGREAAQHAYSKLIMARELPTWQAVAVGSIIKSRVAPATPHKTL